jgi:CBS domain-containing protein
MDDTKDTDPFHKVGNLFPGEAEVVSLAPQTTVREALRIMVENRFSQLPVVEDGRVRGAFTFWSLAQLMVSTPDVSLYELPVEDVMEHLPSVTVQDSLHEVLGLLERHEALLVASPRGLQAIATSMDVLKYFYRLARPFVLLGEIELSLRSLIQSCAPGSVLDQCIDKSVARIYKNRNQPLPASLADMTFDDYRAMITANDNWPLFEGTLGKSRDLVRSKLEKIRDIRNGVFHFRKDISVVEHENLAATRDWLLDKARRANAARGESQ